MCYTKSSPILAFHSFLLISPLPLLSYWASSLFLCSTMALFVVPRSWQFTSTVLEAFSLLSFQIRGPISATTPKFLRCSLHRCASSLNTSQKKPAELLQGQICNQPWAPCSGCSTWAAEAAAWTHQPQLQGFGDVWGCLQEACHLYSICLASLFINTFGISQLQ